MNILSRIRDICPRVKYMMSRIRDYRPMSDKSQFEEIRDGLRPQNLAVPDLYDPLSGLLHSAFLQSVETCRHYWQNLLSHTRLGKRGRGRPSA